jgi:dUTP diphosphatase
MVDNKIRVQIKRLPGNADLPLPAYQSAGAVGMDIYAAVVQEVVVPSGAVVAVPCGFSVAVPEGYEGQVRSRSGLVAKYRVSVPNSPGTIDPDYRGEVQVLLLNNGIQEFRVTRGMRIAQMLILPVPNVEWEEVDDLPVTVRASGGFGHTGE